MRKFFLIVCFLLGGCSTNGSFENGINDFTQIIKYVNQQIEKQEWKFGSFQENSLTTEKIKQLYALDDTIASKTVVYLSISSAQINEIAFFLIDDTMQETVKNAIIFRKQQLHEQWDTHIDGAKELIDQAKEGRIGQYYYFIIGIDAENMVNYISNYS